MIERRQSADRGHANHGWLDSYHSFSFAGYNDPKHMGWGDLRVINDDRIAAGQGFGTHGHRDMEIITYVLEGELAHKDSMGNGSAIRHGDVQVMSAGTGVTHSEFNPSDTIPAHLLQIWIMPAKNGTAPNYQETTFDAQHKRGKLCLLASPDGRGESLTIGQDALLFATLIDGEESVTHDIVQGRLGYVHVARGTVTINGDVYHAGDAAKVTGTTSLVLNQGVNAEVLLFDLIS